MNDQINKPIRPSELLAVMARWVKPAKPIKLRQPMRAVHVQGEAVPEGLLERLGAIEGLDVGQGMVTTQENIELYWRVLKKFVASQKDFAAAFEAARISEDDHA